MSHTIGHTDAILNERASSLDEMLERAHAGAIALKNSEFLGMPKQEVESDFRVGRIVLGATGSEGAPIASQRRRIDRKQNEDVVFQKCGDNGAFGELQTDGDFTVAKVLTQALSPGLDGRGAMLEDGALDAIPPGTARQMSCFLSAQSRPTNAANSEGDFCT